MNIKDLIIKAHNYGGLYEATLSREYNEEAFFNEHKEEIEVIRCCSELKQISNNIDLAQALNHPLWKDNKRNESVYFMDGKSERWQIVYYPIFQDGKTQEYYDEPRALVKNIDKGGFWSKEVPLRYLKT